MALAVLFSCVPDHRNDNLPESAVYFVDNVANNGVQSAVVYDIQTEVDVPVYVYCSGFNGGVPTVSTSVAFDYIEEYNEANGTSYKALPENCYTLDRSKDVVENRKASFNIKFNVPAIMELAAEVDLGEYVVALELESDMDIASYKEKNFGYYIVSPDLKAAIAKVSSVSYDHAAKQATVLVELPFDNAWDFSFEFDYNVTGTYGLDRERGNSIAAKYVCSPMPEDLAAQVVVEGGDLAMAPGTNSREYTLTLPAEYEFGPYKKGETHNFAVSLKNAKLIVDGTEKDVPIEGAAFLGAYPADNPIALYKTPTNYESKGFNAEQNALFRTTLTEYGLDWYVYDVMKTFVWDPQGSQDTYLDRFYNGNGYGWKGAWSAGFGPRNQIPLYIHVDMNEPRDLSGIVYWRRGDGNVGDTKRVEIYALDECTYTWKGSDLSYAPDAITYLGTIDFGPREDAVTTASIAFDSIKAQHLMLMITESTRSNASDCAELEIWY